MSGDHFTGLDNGGDRATENCTVELEYSTKKSKKRKRNLNPMIEDDYHITALERFNKRDLLCVSKPSYVLGLGSINARPENRNRLHELLRKLMRQHNWIEASGVLSVLLKGTCKDTCPRTNRFKYGALMELLKHEQSDPVNTMAISGLYDTWMSRIGINLANKRRRVECTKEDRFIVRLESILFNLMRGNVEDEHYNARRYIYDFSIPGWDVEIPCEMRNIENLFHFPVCIQLGHINFTRNA
uniref:Uncharacterized protein MANES_15G090500 n=1 Tax=Rhizophora mucronata TaxID=61149 RepID=A0A2P2KH69_RHIMU